MKLPSFRFTADQRRKLMRCWKRQAEHEIAEKFLDEAQWSISAWLPNTKKPRTPIAGFIEHADAVYRAADGLLAVLNGLPADVSERMNVYFIETAHGRDWFRQHHEACVADSKHAIEWAIYDGLMLGLTGGEAPPRITARSRLPPDLLATLDNTKSWLNALSIAAVEMRETTKSVKNWQDKGLEHQLLFMLAIEYKKMFGKAPSAANGSIFRKLAAELSTILIPYSFGAVAVKNVCESIALIEHGRV